MLQIGGRRDSRWQRLVLAEDPVEPLSEDRPPECARDELGVRLRLDVGQRAGEAKRDLDPSLRVRNVLRLAYVGDHVVGEVLRRDERRIAIELVVERVGALAEYRVVASRKSEIVASRRAV